MEGIRPPTGLPAEQQKHPVGGGILPPAVLPASKNLQWAEGKHPCAGIRKGFPGAGNTQRQKAFPEVTLDGNPDVECGGVLLSTPSRVQYHRRDQALASGFGKDRASHLGHDHRKTNTTANHKDRPAEPEPRHDSDRGGPGTGQRTRATKRFTGIVSVTTRNNAPCHPTKETTTGRDPTQQAGRKVCRVRPLVPVGSTPRGASTSGLSNTCSTCGLQAPKCQGILILEQASRLDAFSGYPSRT